MARRGGLGKGLGALIPPGGTEVGGLDELPLASIKPNRFQPRDHFDEEALGLLADSIREVGVLQPVLVRPAGDDEYELIAGERRWRAARRVGLQTIPALVARIYVGLNPSLRQAAGLSTLAHIEDLSERGLVVGEAPAGGEARFRLA